MTLIATRCYSVLMRFDDIRPGNRVIVTSRGDLDAVVISKFKSKQGDAFGRPAGTEYVELRRANGKGGTFFNYPHQLIEVSS